MAASYVAERKSGNITAGAFTIVPATNCTAGNTLILVVNHYSANLFSITGITDTKGNTWTIDQSVTLGGGGAVYICSTLQNGGALTTGDTITVATTGTATGAYWLEEFSGQYSVDKVASATGTSGTSVNTGTTAATVNADEFAIAGFITGKSGGGVTWTWTKDANYTNFTTAPPIPTGSQTLSSAAHYRILTATGTQICTDTVSASTNRWAGAIATYKVVAAGTNWTTNPADTLSLSDSITVELGRTAAPADSVTLSDAFTFDRANVIADTVSLADTRTFDRGLNLADTVSLADAVLLAQEKTLADTLSLADSLSTARGFGASIDDTVALADALAFNRGLVIAETLAITDSLAKEIGMVLADILDLSDLATPELTAGSGSNFTVDVNDAVSLADALVFDQEKLIEEIIAVTDALSFMREIHLSDSVALSDAVVRALNDMPIVAIRHVLRKFYFGRRGYY